MCALSPAPASKLDMLGFLHLIRRLCFSRVGWCSIRILAVLTALRPGSYSQFENALNMEQQHLLRCEWKAITSHFIFLDASVEHCRYMSLRHIFFLLSCVSVSSAKPFTWYILDWWRLKYEFLFIHFLQIPVPGLHSHQAAVQDLLSHWATKEPWLN